MADHRHPGVRDRPHRVRHLPAALQLDAIHAALFQQATGVADCLSTVSLVGEERQVADEIRVLRPAPHGFAVVDHLVHGDRHRGIVAQHDHAQRITDQDRIQPRPVRGQRAGIVVGRDHGDRLAPRLLVLERQDGHLLGAICASFHTPAPGSAQRSLAGTKMPLGRPRGMARHWKAGTRAPLRAYAAVSVVRTIQATGF